MTNRNIFQVDFCNGKLYVRPICIYYFHYYMANSMKLNALDNFNGNAIKIGKHLFDEVTG